MKNEEMKRCDWFREIIWAGDKSSCLAALLRYVLLDCLFQYKQFIVWLGDRHEIFTTKQNTGSLCKKG